MKSVQVMTVLFVTLVCVPLSFAGTLKPKPPTLKKSKSCVRTAPCTMISFDSACVARCDQQANTCSQPCVTRFQTCQTQANQRYSRCYQAVIVHCRNAYPNDPSAQTAAHKQCLSSKITQCQQHYQSDVSKCQQNETACYNVCIQQKQTCMKTCMTTRQGRQTCRWKKRTRFGRTFCTTPRMCTVCR